MIRLWLLCCGLLFAGAEGYQWLSHQGWFVHPDLGWPWVVLGGLGLAIASHYPALKTLWPPPASPDLSESTSTSVTSDPATPGLTPVAAAEPLVTSVKTASSTAAPAQSPQSRETPPVPGKSISFDISPPQRR